jgi:hypothetical protein
MSQPNNEADSIVCQLFEFLDLDNPPKPWDPLIVNMVKQMAEEDIRKARVLVGRLKGLSIEEIVPPQTRTQFRTSLQSMLNILRELNTWSFSAHRPDNMPPRIGEFKNQLSLLEPIKIWIPYMKFELLAGADESLNRVREAATEAQKIVGECRTIKAAITIDRHGKLFDQAATAHERQAKRWLIATALLLAGTATAALFLFQTPAAQVEGEPQLVTSIRFLVTRLVLLSMVYYAAVWSSRMYRAHRHLHVVNKHRQDALGTFQTFADAAGGDEATKNAVLLEATRCIFAPAVTGYLGQEEEAPSSRVVEIIKTALDSGKKGNQ